MKTQNLVLFATCASVLTLAQGCGKSASDSGSGAISDVSIANLPSTSSLIKTNSGDTTRSGGVALAPVLRSVSGTAPILTSLSDDNIDQYFWNNLIATIGGGTPNSAQKSEFWGNTIGGPGGMGACQMAQGTGESFSNLISSGGTLCYMKGISTGPAGVTIDNGTAATLFSATTEDKVIKITLTGTDGAGGDMPSVVYFKVYGSNTLGGTDTYKADLWMCKADNSIKQIETITVVKSTGAFSDVSTNDEGSGHFGQSTLTATLAASGDGALTFDETKDRHFIGKYTGTYSGQTNVYKGDLTINSQNQIISKIYRANNGPWGSNTDKVSSIASFSGSNFATLRFLAAGFKGASTNTYSGHTNSNEYAGGIEFQDTHYVSVNNDLATSAAEVNLADAFYTTDLAVPALSTTHTCNEAPTVNVTMDFSTPSISELRTTCDGERYNNYNMCYGSTVQNIQSRMWGP